MQKIYAIQRVLDKARHDTMQGLHARRVLVPSTHRSSAADGVYVYKAWVRSADRASDSQMR